MRFRSSLFIAVVSLFVLTGFGYDVFGDCCGDHPAKQTEHAKSVTQKQAPSSGNDCHCLCHQVISHFTGEPVRVAAAILVPATFVPHADEFPPDAVPVGIDHPPQLA